MFRPAARTVLLAFALLVPPLAASADDAAAPIRRGGQADDLVTFVVQAEDWVETTSATVRLAADIAVEAGSFGSARGDLVAALKGIGGGAVWRVVDFRRMDDQAGFERWRLTAEARVADAALPQLAAQAKAATKPGRSLAVESIDFTPTIAERQAVLETLRTAVYGKITAEQSRIEKAFGGRSFRVQHIDFSEGTAVQPRPMMAEARMSLAKTADAPAGAGGLSGAEKATVTARVALAATAPVR